MTGLRLLPLLCLSFITTLSAAADDAQLRKPLPGRVETQAVSQAPEVYVEYGTLTRQDERLTTGEFMDSWYMDFTAGDLVTIDITSRDFDTYLLVRCDQDASVELDNDDHMESTQHSQIVFQVPTTGNYLIGVTSYEPREMGRYEMSIQVQSAASYVQPSHDYAHVDSNQPRILGVFVGISDYPDDVNDLDHCAQEAVSLHDLMQQEFGMRAEDAMLLIDGDATVGNVLAAINELGSRARPQDTLIFFYSGHGGQWAGSTQQADPDGTHETLFLHDGILVDDDFAAAFNASPAGVALVMLDSCFSGGFAKDVISADGRMGVFSSEEDVSSMNTTEGGFLAIFLMDALSHDRGRSDQNGDGQLTALEFSHYLGERFRDEVRSDAGVAFKSGTPVDPMENLSYQRLVVDRGGVGSDEVLFTWRR